MLGGNHLQQLAAAADRRLEVLALGVWQRTCWEAYAVRRPHSLAASCDPGIFGLTAPNFPIIF